jgi:hypothetical protein
MDDNDNNALNIIITGDLETYRRTMMKMLDTSTSNDSSETRPDLPPIPKANEIRSAAARSKRRNALT